MAYDDAMGGPKWLSEARDTWVRRATSSEARGDYAAAEIEWSWAHQRDLELREVRPAYRETLALRFLRWVVR